MILVSPLVASARQASDLQQQLQQLKEQYDQATRELRARIAALEEAIGKQQEASKQATEAAVSAAQATAQEVVNRTLFGPSATVGAQFQGQVPSRPTYEFLQEAETT